MLMALDVGMQNAVAVHKIRRRPENIVNVKNTNALGNYCKFIVGARKGITYKDYKYDL